jgi:CDP-2,3-bis-(O-geranylgeranyl)-sn-glycerol synthase
MNKNLFNSRRVLSPQEEKWKNVALWFCCIFLILFIGELLLYIWIWNINDWTCVLLLQILLIMPAYLANAGMLLFGKGGKPIDGNKIARDGNRLFGPGKTIKGMILGPLFGVLVSLCIHAILIIFWNGIEGIIIAFWSGEREYILFDSSISEAIDLFKVYMTGARLEDAIGVGLLKLTARVTLVSFFAAGGDLFGSWLKRRMNKNRGEPVWLLDQLDFVIPAVLISMPFIIIDRNFLAISIFIMIFTPFMAIISNTIAYLTGLKSVPY